MNETQKYKLDQQLFFHFNETIREPTLIVMHPQTWVNLCDNVWRDESMAIHRHDPSLKYNGIQVLRSLDVPVGMFEVR